MYSEDLKQLLSSDGDMIPDTIEVGTGFSSSEWPDTDGDGQFDEENWAVEYQANWTLGAAKQEDWSTDGQQADE